MHGCLPFFPRDEALKECKEEGDDGWLDLDSRSWLMQSESRKESDTS